MNAVVKHLRKTASFTLKYPKLNINSLTLKVYMDASYANDFDGSSELDYIIFLADASGKCQPIIWSSHKSLRVIRSVLGSDTMAFADGFDAAYSLTSSANNSEAEYRHTYVHRQSVVVRCHIKVVYNGGEAVDDRPASGERSVRSHVNGAARVPSHQLERARRAEQGQSQHVPGDHPDDGNNGSSRGATGSSSAHARTKERWRASECPAANRFEEHGGRINVIRVNCTVARVPRFSG
jgi:hypothetical protein